MKLGIVYFGQDVLLQKTKEGLRFYKSDDPEEFCKQADLETRFIATSPLGEEIAVEHIWQSDLVCILVDSSKHTLEDGKWSSVWEFVRAEDGDMFHLEDKNLIQAYMSFISASPNF